jgi:hypothetical protein
MNLALGTRRLASGKPVGSESPKEKNDESH